MHELLSVQSEIAGGRTIIDLTMGVVYNKDTVYDLLMG